MADNWEDIVNETVKIQEIMLDGEKPQNTTEIKLIDDFEMMKLKINLLRGIYSYGFEKPSVVQQQTIPTIVSKNDILAQAPAGTGKTGCFAIGVLQNIDEKKDYPQAVIISPTQELTKQINSVVSDLGNNMGIKTELCIGGINIDDNIENTKKAHILIGTPGRLNDLIERKKIDMSRIEIFVMDEVDVLLSRDFLMQTRNIIKRLHEKTQICAFSATLTQDTIETTKKFMNKNAVNILLKQEKLSLSGISQYHINVGEERNKLETLDDLYARLSIGQCIIYVNGVDKTIWLKEQLNSMGHATEAMHSKLSPLERTEIMKLYRDGKCRVLVSTDLLARGIDVQQVSYVINYDLPMDIPNYIHRIGRSGRYGKKGVAINFVSNRDWRQLKAISMHYKCDIPEMPDPEELNSYLKN